MPGTITVVNRKFLPQRTRNTYRIKIDRPSPLGSPFHIGPDGSRTEVMEKYRKFLANRFGYFSFPNVVVIGEIMRIYDAYIEGRDVELVCNCKPKPCHGDIIKEIVENM